MPNGKLKPLSIGHAARSQLDDASIRSEIHIDAAGKYVRYGERALVEKIKSSAALLFEPSPKLWLAEPSLLGLPAVSGLTLTRENLLTGLLANALAACIKANDVSPATLRQLDVRVAHPVWPANVEHPANAAMSRILGKALRMAFEADWATVTVAKLVTHTQAAAVSIRSKVDVVEPVAAAVELLPSTENARRVCAVVDIGAGTTDIGIFQAVAPDSASTVRGRLIRMGEPISVFKAGNLIDNIVMDVLRTKARHPDKLAVEDVRARIRQVKETLFKDGVVQALGVDVHLDDIESHPEARSMARDIRSEFEAAVYRNSSPIVGLMDARTHYVRRLELVMAGGGASMAFIRNALERPFVLDGKHLAVDVVEAAVEVGLELFGADRSRMAVALGGAREEYDELIHCSVVPNSIRLGPL